MKIKMNIISNTIIGSGQSVPGGEDIAVLMDNEGFPYFKGGTLKGIFREEYSNLLYWDGLSTESVKKELFLMLGSSGAHSESDDTKIRFSNFELPDSVKNIIRNEQLTANEISEAFTSIRTFMETSRCREASSWTAGTTTSIWMCTVCCTDTTCPSIACLAM